MKNKIVKLFVILLVAIFILFYLNYIKDNNHTSIVLKKTDDLYLKPPLLKLMPIENDSNFHSDIIQAEDKLKETPESKKILNIVKKIGAGIDIEFYMKIQDQYTEPVSNTEVTFSISNPLGLGAEKVYRSLTDDNGELHISGMKGNNLLIRDINKNGYSFLEGLTHGRLFKGGASNSDGLKYSHYSIDRPFIFKAWKKDIVAKLMILNREGFGILPDGRIYTIDLAQPILNKVKQEGKALGDFELSILREGGSDRYSRGNWSVSIVPLNGGIQETKDLYMNVAPTDGYRNKWSLEFHSNNKSYKDKLLNKNFYLTSRNGKVFSALKVDIKPFANKKMAAVFITSKTNINSSRVLVEADELSGVR